MAALAAGGAVAQTAAPSPGQVTPQTLRPPEAAPAETSLPPPQAHAPLGSEAVSLRVGSVSVEGGLPALAAETDALTTPFRDHQGTVADLYQLAATIEAAYARHGYVLARVSVPRQSLSDGAVVRLVVIDGFIEAVNADAVPERARAAVQRRAARLIGRHWLTLAKIERALVLAGATPGVDLHSTLSPGDTAGGVELIVDGGYAPVSVSFGADNRLGPEFGDWEVSAQASLNGVLGQGELIYVSTFFRPDEHVFDHLSARRVLGVGAIAPLGSDGWWLNPEFTIAETNPNLGPGTARTRGEFRRLMVKLGYAAIKTRREDLELSLGVEGVDERQTATDFGTRVSNDRIRDVVLAADWTRGFSGGGLVGGNLQFTQGFDGLGARSAADVAATGVPFSRQGVSPVFSKIEGSARVSKRFANDFAITATGRFQVSLSGALAASEQFNLDAPDGLSTFPIGRLTGDSGWTARGEIARVFAVPGTVQASVAPYVFAAVGQGHLSQPTALESSTLSAQAYGGGVRITVDRPGKRGALFAGVEVGRALSNGTQPDPTRLVVDLGVRF